MNKDYSEKWTDILNNHQITQASLADVLECSTAKISNFVNKENLFSLELFDEIAFVLKLGDDERELFKINIDSVHNKRQVQQDLAQIYKVADISQLKKLPMFKMCCPHAKPNQEELRDAIFSYFGVNNVDELILNVKSQTEKLVVMYRQWQRDSIEPSSSNLLLFLKEAKYQSKQLNKTNPFDIDKLSSLAKQAHKYTLDSKKGLLYFCKKLEECGVYVIQQAHLTKTYLNGACFIDDDSPIIVLTYRLKGTDNVWFSLLHEVAHIIYDLDYLAENGAILDEEELTNSREQRAEKFARDALKTSEIVKQAWLMKKSRPINMEDLEILSKKYEVGKDIIVGVLQYAKVMPYTFFNNLKQEATELKEV